jgi:hypothetical protein
MDNVAAEGNLMQAAQKTGATLQECMDICESLPTCIAFTFAQGHCSPCTKINGTRESLGSSIFVEDTEGSVVKAAATVPDGWYDAQYSVDDDGQPPTNDPLHLKQMMPSLFVHKTQITVLILGSSLYRQALLTFCQSVGAVHTSEFANFTLTGSSADTPGAANMCTWKRGDRIFRMVQVIQYGTALHPPYHLKYATNHRTVLIGNRTLVPDSILRWPRIVHMVQAAGYNPDLILFDHIPWDIMRLWDNFMPVFSTMFPPERDGIVHAEYRHVLERHPELARPIGKTEDVRLAYLRSWRENTSALVKAVHNQAPNTPIVWLGQPVAPNRGGRWETQQKDWFGGWKPLEYIRLLNAEAKLQASRLQSSNPDLRLTFFDYELLIARLANATPEWEMQWCCEGGYYHPKQQVSNAFWYTILTSEPFTRAV